MTDNPFKNHIRSALSTAQALRQAQEEQSNAVAQNQLDQHAREMAERFQTIVAGIPGCITCHFSEGRTYGRIMRLRFDESEEDPRWESGFWDSRRPDPNKLKEAALQVFAYCYQHNLKPYLVRDYDFDVHHFFLYMGINCCDHVG